MNSKGLITCVLLAIIVLMMGIIVFGSKNHPKPVSPDVSSLPKTVEQHVSNDIIFFYGASCPHCREVEQWMQANKIQDKVIVMSKEVYDNKQSAQELVSAARNCGLPTDSISVPLLYADGKCLIGAPDIIDHLSHIIEIVQASASAEKNKQ